MSASTLFGLLADDCRRYALYCLSEHDVEEITRDALTEQVAEWTTDADESARDDLHERIAIELHHVHLPKLADAGLVEYDRSDGAIRVADSTEKLDLERVRALET